MVGEENGYWDAFREEMDGTRSLAMMFEGTRGAIDVAFIVGHTCNRL